MKPRCPQTLDCPFLHAPVFSKSIPNAGSQAEVSTNTVVAGHTAMIFGLRRAWSSPAFFFQNFLNCELLSGAGTGRPARTAGFQVSRAGAFRRVPVSFKYLQWLQAGRARSVPPYGRHSVFFEGGIPMPQVPSGRQGVASSCRIRLRSTIRSSASS